MTDKLGIYNGALLLLGARSLINLTEQRESRRVLDRIWSRDFIKRCLEEGQWQWASRAVQMDPSTSVEPDFGYQYAYQKPADWVRTVMLSSDEFFTEPYTRFTDERGYIFCDTQPLYAKYVSNDAQYGADLSLWPPSFGLFAEAVMAVDAAPRLTGVIVSVESLEKTLKKRKSDAQNLDGVSRPTVFPSRGSWNNARQGRFSTFGATRILPPGSS